MPTKSNNTGGAGGKRPGAGRKPKALTEKEANGNPGGRALKIMDIPDVNGVTMPKPHDFLSATQRDGGQLQAKEIYEDTRIRGTGSKASAVHPLSPRSCLRDTLCVLRDGYSAKR